MFSIPIFVLLFSFCSITFGELDSPSNDNNNLISSILYGDYDRECPKGLAVTDFQFKLINSSSNDGSNGESKHDISLNGHCTRHIDDNALAAGNKINDSSVECRYAETFNIQGSVNETDYTKMCKPGEYIGGAASSFVNNNRLLKLKCCQSPNLIHDPSFGCYNVKANEDNIKSLVQRGNGCPVDVLTGAGFTNGTNLIGRYCALSLAGLDYKNTTCKEDRQRDIMAQMSSSASKVRKGLAELLTVILALYFAFIFVH